MAQILNSKVQLINPQGMQLSLDGCILETQVLDVARKSKKEQQSVFKDLSYADCTLIVQSTEYSITSLKNAINVARKKIQECEQWIDCLDSTDWEDRNEILSNQMTKNDLEKNVKANTKKIRDLHRLVSHLKAYSKTMIYNA